MRNVNQYATLLSAAGCKLNYITEKAELEVTDYPKGKADIIKDVLEDISKFDDTANFVDGMSAPFLANTINREESCFAPYRDEVLTHLGLMKDGKFISQELALIKTNRSWHTSQTPNSCSYFGDICINRGIIKVEGKRGRKSNRKPTDYHTKNSNGIIAREQLVTPALEALWKIVPDSVLTSNAGHKLEFNLSKFKNMPNEQVKDILSKKLIEIEAIREMMKGTDNNGS